MLFENLYTSSDVKSDFVAGYEDITRSNKKSLNSTLNIHTAGGILLVRTKVNFGFHIINSVFPTTVLVKSFTHLNQKFL